ncbi:hypothetical protein MCAP1_000844 [Malassezia caprae]|uniref:Leptomycin B resistance protein pmd1 n=1 Tax=Malassezia caprae TaxID=1381934 RepID=A0AAF0IVL5_9BASI|nr:hypothetical protein MCAP1_000844 [Malassezia caprae]
MAETLEQMPWRPRAWLTRLRRGLPSMSYVRLFCDLSRPEWAALVVGTLAAIAAGVPLPIIGVLFGKMVNGFNEQACAAHSLAPPDPAQQDEFLQAVRHHVEQIITVAAVNFALIWIYTSCWSFLGERIVRRLRERYVRALLSQDMSYFDMLPPGEISTRLGENLIAVQNGTSEKVGILLSSIAYFVASYITAFLLLPVLAAQLISLVPAFLLVSLLGAHFVSRYTSRMSSHLSDATSIATEALQNLPIVQAFQAQAPLGQLFHAHLGLVRRSGMYRALSAATMLGCLFFVAYAANALAFHSGSRMVSDRMRTDGDDAANTVGSVYTVIFLLLDASFVVGQISPYLQTFSAAGGAGAQLLHTIQLPAPIDALSEHGIVPPSSDAPLGFCFRDVSLAYPARPEATVLRQLTLDIEPGQRIGICGFSGSGKSTIVSLLHRFYEPTHGSITLDDGTPIHALQVSWLRSQMGLVGQEPVLFNCTVLESIAHGLLGSPAMAHLFDSIRWLEQYAFDHPNMPPDWMSQCPAHLRERLDEVLLRCEEAARLSYAHDFIMRLPQGYATRVGDSGRSLSGGQKQRIALARAVVKKPRVLVLDEATAALDSHSEMAVQAAFDRVSANRTTIAIAHRLSTIRDYDKIVVMAHGEVLEQGTHAELLRRQGHYASLVRAQSEQEPVEVAEVDTESVSSIKDADVQMPSEHETEELQGRVPVPLPAQPIVPPPNLGVAGPTEEPEEAPTMSCARALGRLLSMALGPWPYALLGVCASAVIGGAFSGEAVLFGHVIEALNPCKLPEQVESRSDQFALFFFVLAIIELVAYFLSGASFGFVSEWLLIQLRQRLFSVLVTRPMAWYETEQASPGTLMANLSTDTSYLGGLTGTVIGTMVSILVNLIAGITLAHIVAWRIAIVILATVPILVAAGYLRLKVIADFQKRHETAYAQSTALAVEAVSYMRTVAALGRERDVLQLFAYSLERPYRESMRHLVVGNMFLAISLSISYFIYGFAYWWGSKNVAEQRYSQVAFFTVLPALLFSAQSSGQLLAFAPDFTKAQVSASNIFSLLDRAEAPAPRARRARAAAMDVEAEKAPVPMVQGPLPVTFSGVRFTYAGRDTPALDGLDLDIPAGAFAAFIGASGSGKSTAMSLIENFYAPSHGTVRVGGHATTSLTSGTLRSSMAIVPQEAMLFRGSIEFNVALGLEDPLSVSAVRAQLDEAHVNEKSCRQPADPRVVAACEAAHVHSTIEALPDQYSTDIGTGGSQLSGGQKQRVAIARALVRQPKLLLLDESTSAMDAASEQAFQETLRQLHEARTCTIIAIAHRMRTIRTADVIFLFDHGRVVARGTHAELMHIKP